MTTAVLPAGPRERERIRKRKVRILFCAIVISLFTGMSKILIPGAVFSELQEELHFSAAILGTMTAATMYCIAASQVAMGILANRYGGVRILLFGGGCFVIGFTIFPLLSSPVPMILLRGLCGIGAGTVFLGITKLLIDLYPKRFSLFFSITLFVSYIGPIAAGNPAAMLVRATSWRCALLLFAAVPLFAFVMILLSLKGTLRKAEPGHAFREFLVLCRNRALWRLYICTSLIFGIHYAVMTTLGRKALEDQGGLSPRAASMWISALAVIVAANSLLSNVTLKLFGGRRKAVVIFCSCSTLAGVLLAAASFQCGWGGAAEVTAFILLANAAGYFSIFGTIAREVVPARLGGLAIAMLNGAAFVMIAAGGNAAGWVLAGYEEPEATGAILYPAAAYRDFFLLAIPFALLSLALAFTLPETKPGLFRRRSLRRNRTPRRSGELRSGSST